MAETITHPNVPTNDAVAKAALEHITAAGEVGATATEIAGTQGKPRPSVLVALFGLSSRKAIADSRRTRTNPRGQAETVWVAASVQESGRQLVALLDVMAQRGPGPMDGLPYPSQHELALQRGLVAQDGSGRFAVSAQGHEHRRGGRA